jgi:histidine phosphotransferase ChpT
VTEEVAQALSGEALNVDARHVQPFLTHKLSRSVNTALAILPMDGAVELKAGQAAT